MTDVISELESLQESYDVGTENDSDIDRQVAAGFRGAYKLIDRAKEIFAAYENNAPRTDNLDLSYGPESWEDVLNDLIEAI